MGPADLSAYVLFVNIFFVKCGYPPVGDEVQPGSVLLPASRRGRYLANIIRRQAVDGTGIKFNKDADRMNAEAKKKVDVLSEELLPYIIAEQERRTTLYKRIMTAIQNGEKGVTIAEIRNKPPLIIRKGLMFRCPANRAPKEPDGSGTISCEGDIDPAPVMYDSCLSAEDRELFVAENKYFFCNRHKVEGPDLPRNGSTVIGCAPTERTSLNYTSNKCALEDTDDVVVHYRYYPDRTYKYVTELDPDREVCDHWNPCQIGYIYSLPSRDQATAASELWQIIPPIPEDSYFEFIPIGQPYETSLRRVAIPPNYNISHIQNSDCKYSGGSHGPEHKYTGEFRLSVSEKYVTVGLVFDEVQHHDLTPMCIVFRQIEGEGEKSVPLVRLRNATVKAEEQTKVLYPGQKTDPVLLRYRCRRCKLEQVIIRSTDYSVYNLEPGKFRTRETSDRKKYIQINLDEVLPPRDFGWYFGVFTNDEGEEERLKLLTMLSPELVFGCKAGSGSWNDVLSSNRWHYVAICEKNVRYGVINVELAKEGVKEGEHYEKTVTYSCESCEITDVLCNSESVLGGGKVSIIPSAHMVSLNFPVFEDSDSCVYVGVFSDSGTTFQKELAVIENDSPDITVSEVVEAAPTSEEGGKMEIEVKVDCGDDCELDTVSVNGIALNSKLTRRMWPHYYGNLHYAGQSVSVMYTSGIVMIKILEFHAMYSGWYQCRFKVRGHYVTRTLMHVRPPIWHRPHVPPYFYRPQPRPRPQTTTATIDTESGIPHPNTAANETEGLEELTTVPGGDTANTGDHDEPQTSTGGDESTPKASDDTEHPPTAEGGGDK